jgi:hypothetical protein
LVAPSLSFFPPSFSPRRFRRDNVSKRPWSAEIEKIADKAASKFDGRALESIAGRLEQRHGAAKSFDAVWFPLLQRLAQGGRERPAAAVFLRSQLMRLYTATAPFASVATLVAPWSLRASWKARLWAAVLCKERRRAAFLETASPESLAPLFKRFPFKGLLLVADRPVGAAARQAGLRRWRAHLPRTPIFLCGLSRRPLTGAGLESLDDHIESARLRLPA